MVEVEVPSYRVVEEPVVLSAEKTAVLVVDMQNDFVHPRGKLFVPEAAKTVDAIKRLLERAREAGALVVYTQDWHTRDDYEFAIWGEHAVEGTWGAEVVEELKPREGDVIIKKLRYDPFFGTPLDHILRLKKIETLVVTGTVANICVLHAVGTASLLGYRVVVPIDCISALTDFDKHAALRQIDFLYRGTLTKSEHIEFE